MLLNIQHSFEIVTLEQVRILGTKEGSSFSLKMILVNLGHVASIATEKRQRKRGRMCREARTLGFTCIKASRPGAALREGKAGDKHMPSSVSLPGS